jgi:glycosyltransferase involved in cell wall biosynthesis
LKIALDARYLNASGSGVGTYTENLLRQMLRLESENNYILVTRKPGLAAQFDAERCTDFVFPAPPRSRRTVRSLGRKLEDVPFDVFHSTFNIMPDALNRPSVVTIHDIIPLLDPGLIDEGRLFKWTAGRFWSTRMRQAARSATRLVTVSQASADAIGDFFGPEVAARTLVTGSGVDPYFREQVPDDSSLAREARGGDFPYLLTVGQGSPRKNHLRAVEAFLEAFAADDPTKFVLVKRLNRGAHEFDRLIKRPEVAKRVVLASDLSRPQLRALYRHARVMFLPSLVEGFGLPIIEAMACGAPVVTSDLGATAEVAGGAAVLCDPYDVTQMAACLVRATTDGPERDDMIAKGIVRASEFNFEACALRTLEVYRDVSA